MVGVVIDGASPDRADGLGADDDGALARRPPELSAIKLSRPSTGTLRNPAEDAGMPAVPARRP